MSNLFTPQNVEIASTIVTALTGLAAVLIAVTGNIKNDAIISKQNTERKFNLTVIPHELVPRAHRERIFLSIDFINNSSMPVSITDLNLNNKDKKMLTTALTRTANTYKFFDDAGNAIKKTNAVRVSEKIGEHKVYGEVSPNEGIENIFSTELPVTIPPYSSISGYFGFVAGNGSGDVLIESGDIELEVITNRESLIKNFTFEKTLVFKARDDITMTTK